MKPIPHLNPAKWPANLSRSRFASTFRTDKPDGCQIALLGLPDDRGVWMNNGRPGAAHGPAAFREALCRYGAAEPAAGILPSVFDAGDVEVSDSLEETHRRVTSVTTSLLEAGLFPIAIGGGHDLTYPFVRAVAARFPKPVGVYFDAHLDVRETTGSGMPFRRLIEDCGVRALHLHGFRPLVNSREHFHWFAQHGGITHRDRAKPALPRAKNLFVSFDLDVLDGAHAPGVSALNPSGWSVPDAERWVSLCGANRAVRCFDIMELNPAHDVDARTARIAAHLFLTFLLGFAKRPSK
jgi:formimidoylglutamase